MIVISKNDFARFFANIDMLLCIKINVISNILSTKDKSYAFDIGDF